MRKDVLSYLSLSGCGAVGSALDWGSRGRKFKSSHSDQNKESTFVGSLFFVLNKEKEDLNFSRRKTKSVESFRFNAFYFLWSTLDPQSRVFDFYIKLISKSTNSQSPFMYSPFIKLRTVKRILSSYTSAMYPKPQGLIPKLFSFL